MRPAALAGRGPLTADFDLFLNKGGHFLSLGIFLEHWSPVPAKSLHFLDKAVPVP